MDIANSNAFSFRYVLLGLLLITLFIFMSIPKNWEDATTKTGEGTLTLSDDWAGKVERKKEQYANHDLYALTAAADGYFLCKHCPTGKFYLGKGEI